MHGTDAGERGTTVPRGLQLCADLASDNNFRGPGAQDREEPEEAPRL